MKPRPGYYRQLLSDKNVRIAFTHTPIVGCTRIKADSTIAELKQSNDPYAQYYINGLESGDMVTIVENTNYDRYYSCGELYFKS